MTIESKLDALTTALTLLTKQLSEMAAPTVITESVNSQPSTINIVPVVQPVVAAAAAPVQTVPEMPAPPVFEAAVAPSNDPLFQEPAPAKKTAPFTDAKGLTDYVIGVYTSLGPEKGAGIQTVIVSLGYDNINDIKPEHYDALFAGVEALKG